MIEKVEGKNKGKFFLYALSTCIWCKKTKGLLDDIGVEYSYVFLDKLDEKDKTEKKKELMKYNPRCSFPTIVINDKECIVGFKEDEIRRLLE